MSGRARVGVIAAGMLVSSLCRAAAAVAGPAAPVPTIAPPPAQAVRVPWRVDLPWAEAVATAGRSGQSILIDFTAAWCGPCRLLDVMVFTESSVIQALGDVLTLQVDLDQPGADDLPRRFGITTIPTLVWCGPDGVEKDRLNGYVSSARFLEMLADWRAGLTLDAGLARRLAARPQSPALLLESARRSRLSGHDREAIVALQRLLNFSATADTALVTDARKELARSRESPVRASTGITEDQSSGIPVLRKNSLPEKTNRPRIAGPVQRHAGGGLEGDTDRPCFETGNPKSLVARRILCAATVNKNMASATELQHLPRVFFIFFCFLVLQGLVSSQFRHASGTIKLIF